MSQTELLCFSSSSVSAPDQSRLLSNILFFMPLSTLLSFSGLNSFMHPHPSNPNSVKLSLTLAPTDLSPSEFLPLHY